MILIKGVPMSKYWSREEIESDYDWITDITMALLILEAEKPNHLTWGEWRTHLKRNFDKGKKP